MSRPSSKLTLMSSLINNTPRLYNVAKPRCMKADLIILDDIEEDIRFDRTYPRRDPDETSDTDSLDLKEELDQ